MVQKTVAQQNQIGQRHNAVTASVQISTLLASVLLVLVALDIFSPPGPPLSPLIGSVTYGAKTAIGMLTVVFGLWSLFAARLPISFRIPTIFYALIVISWFIIWLLTPQGTTNTNDGAITYLLNPTYSVWSWLLILLVPLVAHLNKGGQLTDAIGRIPLPLGLALVLIPALGMALLNWNLNASNAGVAMLFLLACRPAKTLRARIAHLFIAIVVCAAMFIANYRIYALGAILYAANIFAPKTKRFLVFQLIAISLLPLAFQLVMDALHDYLVKTNNPLFYNTRTFLFQELTKDLSPLEMWTGRGINGRYFSPYFLYLSNHYTGTVGYNNIWRTTSEIGWLNIVLHYGIQGAALFYMAVISPVFAHNTRRLPSNIPVEGIYCFLPVMFLLFAGELWNAISASYFCWFVALGALLTASPINTNGSARAMMKAP